MAIITSEYFAQALIKAGIIPDTDRVRRIVIDAQAGELLVVYVEYFGQEQWLDVAPLLTGVEVIAAPS